MAQHGMEWNGVEWNNQTALVVGRKFRRDYTLHALPLATSTTIP
jgi:hypothetical protein